MAVQLAFHALLTIHLLLWGAWDGYSTLVPCQGVSAMGGHLRATFLTVHTFLPCNLEAPALAGFLSLWQNAREKETK